MTGHGHLLNYVGLRVRLVVRVRRVGINRRRVLLAGVEKGERNLRLARLFVVGAADEPVIGAFRFASIRNVIAGLGFEHERLVPIYRDILDELEANPSAIRRTRKFLLVYLDSTSKVTNGYANTHLQADIPELEQNFRNVLDSIESVFKDQKAKLLQEDLFDLDVQIEVLTKQLKHEGIV